MSSTANRVRGGLLTDRSVATHQLRKEQSAAPRRASDADLRNRAKRNTQPYGALAGDSIEQQR
jgi:hypothetical protein